MRRVFCEVASKPGMVATLTCNPTLDDTVETDRLVPDDVSHARRLRLDPGGKGINVSRTLNRLQHPTIAYGPIAGWTGNRLAELLDAEGVAHCFTHIPGETRVNLMINVLADHTQFRLDYPGPPLRPDDINLLLADMSALRPKPAFWAMGGSLPPGAPVDTYAVAIQQARRQGVRAILDADGEALKIGVKAGPFLIKPNEHELGRLVGRDLRTREDHLAAAREVLDTSGVTIVLVTLGAKGALAVSRDEVWALTPPPVQPKSRTGAGDATVAGFAKALVAGETLLAAARYAITVGTATVLTPGTELARREDIQWLLPLVRAEKVSVTGLPPAAASA